MIGPEYFHHCPSNRSVRICFDGPEVRLDRDAVQEHRTAHVLEVGCLALNSDIREAAELWQNAGAMCLQNLATQTW